jgi:hypothetical protein
MYFERNELVDFEGDWPTGQAFAHGACLRLLGATNKERLEMNTGGLKAARDTQPPKGGTTNEEWTEEMKSLNRRFRRWTQIGMKKLLFLICVNLRGSVV